MRVTQIPTNTVINNLCCLYAETTPIPLEAEKVKESLREFLDDKTFLKVEEALGAITASYETQAFTMGFKVGIRTFVDLLHGPDII